MNKGYFLTGGNLGDRFLNLEKAKKLIEKNIGKIIKQSAIYETAAWGISNQADFLNQVLYIETTLSTENCLQKIFLIEKKMGRIRTIKNAARIIDIDILFFNNEVIKKDNLLIPHPEIQNRKFVLVPMSELAPQLIHPVFNLTIAELLESCKDRLAVKMIAIK